MDCEADEPPGPAASSLRLLHLRVRLTPTAPLIFGNPGTTIRGALGTALRFTPSFAAHFFDGRKVASRPSGLADLPRPFVIRAEHLAGVVLPPGKSFSFTISFFDLRRFDREVFTDTLSLMASSGLGAAAIVCSLDSLEWQPLQFQLPFPSVSHLDGTLLCVDYQTPIELRVAGKAAILPHFLILMSRLRDRISALSELYGDGPLGIDFARFSQLAEDVHMSSHDLLPRRGRRFSTRTKVWHPLNGLTGRALYIGPWQPYENWLRLGEYTGAGKQTAFGKGAFRISKVDQNFQSLKMSALPRVEIVF